MYDRKINPLKQGIHHGEVMNDNLTYDESAECYNEVLNHLENIDSLTNDYLSSLAKLSGLETKWDDNVIAPIADLAICGLKRSGVPIWHPRTDEEYSDMEFIADAIWPEKQPIMTKISSIEQVANIPNTGIKQYPIKLRPPVNPDRPIQKSIDESVEKLKLMFEKFCNSEDVTILHF